MANFNKQFQDEVRRLARKECKDDIARLRKDAAEGKRVIAELKRRIAALEKDNKQLAKQAGPAKAEAAPAPEEPAARARISAKTIRTMRAKLRLTQAEFAKLLGVSAQSVYQWEAKEGQLNLRSAAKIAVVEAKGIGAREAKRRLEAKES